MLIFFLSAVVPLCILDFVLRTMEIPPPAWLGDVLSLALFAVAAAYFHRAWKRHRQPDPPREKPLEGNWQASLPCLVHEIRNYSSVIKGNARLLRARMEAGSDLEPLGRLERTTDKIEALAQEILDASACARLAVSEPLCLRALIESCISDHFPDRRESFRIDADGPLPAIPGDARKLERVFLNLFRNAWEADASNVHLRLAIVGDKLRLTVEDDGRGCESDAMTRLFQPLYTTKKGKGGTGLGLYLVKSILEAHGGAICAASRAAGAPEGTGMIFCLDFPIETGGAVFEPKHRPSRALGIPSEGMSH